MTAGFCFSSLPTARVFQEREPPASGGAGAEFPRHGVTLPGPGAPAQLRSPGFPGSRGIWGLSLALQRDERTPLVGQHLKAIKNPSNQPEIPQNLLGGASKWDFTEVAAAGTRGHRREASLMRGWKTPENNNNIPKKPPHGLLLPAAEP